MNRYQEALDYLAVSLQMFDETVDDKTYRDELDAKREVARKALQELVDKATLKKPINQSTPVVRQGNCPNCKGELRKLGGRNEVVIEGQLYCCSCGQALDWSEE